jgi:hypothetical protein
MKTWPHTRKTAATLTKDVALKADQHNNNNHFPAFYSGEMAVSNTSPRDPPKNYSCRSSPSTIYVDRRPWVSSTDSQINTAF